MRACFQTERPVGEDESGFRKMSADSTLSADIDGIEGDEDTFICEMKNRNNFNPLVKTNLCLYGRHYF